MRKKGLGKLVSARTDALSNAMKSLPIREKTRWEIAFQIAEISPELEFLIALVRKPGKGTRITAENIKEIYGIVQWHWPMHLRPLRKALLRALDEMALATVERRPQIPVSRRKPPYVLAKPVNS